MCGKKQDKSGRIIHTDYSYNSPFTEAELHFLIDSVLYSTQMPENHRKELIDKLKSLRNERFSKSIKHTVYIQKNISVNKSFFSIIDFLRDAITKERKVLYEYTSYGTDLKPHPKTDATGNSKKYTINPYYLAMKNGRYYLICNSDEREGLSNFRVDRIKNIKILDEPRRPLKEIIGDNSLRLDDYK